MDINMTANGSELMVKLIGRLDTISSPKLDEELKAAIGDTSVLIFDLKELEYISSAGLRVLLSSQKKMNRQGKMLVRNANETVMEIFDITGFSDILTIE